MYLNTWVNTDLNVDTVDMDRSGPSRSAILDLCPAYNYKHFDFRKI